MKYLYYIEFYHANSDEENYDMQSKWFKTKNKALMWLRLNFDYICADMNVFVVKAEFHGGDDYDIIESEKVAI